MFFHIFTCKCKPLYNTPIPNSLNNELFTLVWILTNIIHMEARYGMLGIALPYSNQIVGDSHHPLDEVSELLYKSKKKKLIRVTFLQNVINSLSTWMVRREYWLESTTMTSVDCSYPSPREKETKARPCWAFSLFCLPPVGFLSQSRLQLQNSTAACIKSVSYITNLREGCLLNIKRHTPCNPLLSGF